MFRTIEIGLNEVEVEDEVEVEVTANGTVGDEIRFIILHNGVAHLGQE